MLKKALISSLILIMFFSLAGWAQAQEVERESDILQTIIDLVVENNPILESQRSLVGEIEEMPEPGAGLIDLPQTSFLSISQLNQLRSQKLERKQTLEIARQAYENLRKSILIELLTGITTISKLENKREGLNQLESFLNERKESLIRQVEAGLEEPTALFDLTERIVQNSVDIENTSGELKTLKLQIALTLGGTEWQELLGLLNQLK